MKYLAYVAIDEDVTAIQISMNNARLMRVKIIQSPEDLNRPFLEGLKRDVPVLLPVVPQIARSASLRDEIERIMLRIFPEMVKKYDVFIVKSLEKLDLRTEPNDHGWIATEVPEADLVPGHVRALALIECAIHLLHGTTA